MSHALLDSAFDNPYPVQLVTSGSRTDELVLVNIMELGREVIHAKRVVRYIEFLLADDLPVKTVRISPEHRELVHGVLVFKTDLWRIITVCRQPSYTTLARKVVVDLAV